MDSFLVQYNILLKYLTSRYPCRTVFDIEHALFTKRGEWITLCHNEFRNVTVQELTKVCCHVRIKPQPKLLAEEVLHHHSTNATNDTKVDTLEERPRHMIH